MGESDLACRRGHLDRGSPYEHPCGRSWDDIYALVGFERKDGD